MWVFHHGFMVCFPLGGINCQFSCAFWLLLLMYIGGLVLLYYSFWLAETSYEVPTVLNPGLTTKSRCHPIWNTNLFSPRFSGVWSSLYGLCTRKIWWIFISYLLWDFNIIDLIIRIPMNWNDLFESLSYYKKWNWIDQGLLGQLDKCVLIR